MKKLLTGKAGVTVLEGVIALGLLALVAGGAFGVLLSASRQNLQPTLREEMALAVEKANNDLKAYVGIANALKPPVPTLLRGGLCCAENGYSSTCTGTPLDTREHDISCKLPPVCDKNQSAFSYQRRSNNTIQFSITCNGYKL